SRALHCRTPPPLLLCSSPPKRWSASTPTRKRVLRQVLREVWAEGCTRRRPEPVGCRHEGAPERNSTLREVEYENSDSASSLLLVLLPKQTFNHMPGRISEAPCGPSSSARFVREG